MTVKKLQESGSLICVFSLICVLNCFWTKSLTEEEDVLGFDYTFFIVQIISALVLLFSFSCNGNSVLLKMRDYYYD